MRYYFAGAYTRRIELATYADRIEEYQLGMVVSRWLTDPQEGLDAGFSAGGLETAGAIQKAWEYGERDILDLADADVIVSFTGQGGRGGRHIEHGIAMLIADQREFFKEPRRMRLVIVGPREHVFHCHPATEQYATWNAFLKHEIEQYNREETQ